ncbi:MAG TPA: HAMP domain-containing sensor histidine kinase [Ktedonobacterales bacterium]|nr:HAMP domain-containing sensor histidine kinase [Ktedonobacterales bacterium]
MRNLTETSRRLEREPARSGVRPLSTRMETPYETSELLNIIGHELRSPITPLKMRLQQARRRLQRERQRERDIDDLSKALYQVERMQQRLALYLDAAFLMQGLLTLALRPTDLSEATRRLSGIYALGEDNRSIRLEETGQPLFGIWDGPRVDTALRELLGNALKYTTGDITIRLKRHGQFARVEVEDAGPAMPASLRKHIFEPYITGCQNNHGLGLGLHVAREIVHLHGGEMGLRANVAGGSLFWFTLPLSE